jgi:hypothetical protein
VRLSMSSLESGPGKHRRSESRGSRQVSVTFSAPHEATNAANSLEFLWKHRFASARLAGQTQSYQDMVERLFAKVEACSGDSAAASHLEGKHVKGLSIIAVCAEFCRAALYLA